MKRGSKVKIEIQQGREKEFSAKLVKIDKRIDYKTLRNLMLDKGKEAEFFEIINVLIENTTINFQDKKRFIEKFFYDGNIENFTKDESIDLIEFLLKKGLLELNRTYGDMSLLLNAVNRKKYQMVEKLIDLGADANIFYNGNIPLSYAILNIDAKGVEILLKKGANKDLKIYGIS